jgi:thiol-disulfide isomerase/thioredoxin
VSVQPQETANGGWRRWAVAGAVLLVALAVALWPRASSETPTTAVKPPPDLATLRTNAALAPCPTAGAAPPPPGVLDGITVPCLGDGGAVPLAAALAGRDTLLNVWSHTCEPCREELPVLQEYARRPDAVRVLGVQVDGSEQAGLAMLTALGVTLPSVTDPDNLLRAALSAPPVLPVSFLVTGSGAVWLVNPPVVFRSPDQVAEVVRQFRGGA